MRQAYTRDELMIVTAARQLADRTTCFVGIGLPSAAANLARLTHAPEAVLIYESGTIGTRPTVLPLSIGDSELADTAATVVSVPEMFRYWLQAGRIDVGFLGAAQVDRCGNINSTVIGDYRRPTVRLPGAGGAPEIASCCGEVIIMVRHSLRTLVEKVDFVTSSGYLDGGDARERLGIPGRGPTRIITDLAVLVPDALSREFIVASIHPGVTREQVAAGTGWALRFPAVPAETEPPQPCELEVLRNLESRTAIAHAPPDIESALSRGRLKETRA